MGAPLRGRRPIRGRLAPIKGSAAERAGHLGSAGAMARVKQAVGAQPGKKTIKKSKLKPPPSSLARRVSVLRKKLRFSRKRLFLRLPTAFIRGLLGEFGLHVAAWAALQAGCEVHLLTLLENWGLCARHAKRAVVEAADVRLVRCIQRKRV